MQKEVKMAGKRGAPMGNQNAKGGRVTSLAAGMMGPMFSGAHAFLNASAGKTPRSGYHATGGFITNGAIGTLAGATVDAVTGGSGGAVIAGLGAGTLGAGANFAASKLGKWAGGKVNREYIPGSVKNVNFHGRHKG